LLSDTYLPPGNEALWREATVPCQEKLKDIIALPDHLEAISKDSALVERKRHAMRQLWMMYGPDFFVYDIQKQFLSLANETIDFTRTAFSYSKLLSISNAIYRAKCIDESTLRIFTLGCSSRIMADPLKFLSHYNDNEVLRVAFIKAKIAFDSKYGQHFSRILEHKNVAIEVLFQDL
jgi:hypothetical protein